MKNPRWNPYLVGALIGLLSILTFSLANKPLGMSTGLAQASGACAMPILGADKVAANTYWAKTAIPTWDYSTLFLVGTMAGAALAPAKGSMAAYLASTLVRFMLTPALAVSLYFLLPVKPQPVLVGAAAGYLLILVADIGTMLKAMQQRSGNASA